MVNDEISIDLILNMLAAFIVVLVIVMIFKTIFLIMRIAGQWKMFEKMMIPGFSAIIPYYNDYMMCVGAGAEKYTIFYIGSDIACLLLPSLTVVSPIFIILFGVAAVIRFVMSFAVSFKVADKFGKGKTTGVGLVFFPGIMSMILGFGDAVCRTGKPDSAVSYSENPDFLVQGNSNYGTEKHVESKEAEGGELF